MPDSCLTEDVELGAEIEDWYSEMIDEIFTRTEQSVGAQIHPLEKVQDGGDG